MGACPSCGVELPLEARFCLTCGTRVDAAAPVPAREVRKTVTVLFSDVTGSTALGEALDPEAVRGVMLRYFAAMRAAIEQHGGTVEKFIGDAVMAVFGVPVVHEDDALRAVRAATDMRAALEALNTELGAERGVRLRTRTGITTGEVVAGDPTAGQALVTGDTVNTAARLEQAATPGDILIGAPTWRLVRDAVTVEPVEAVSAKGKAAPVAAYRLITVTPGADGSVRRFGAPLVGRQRELSRLAEAWRDAVEHRTSTLFTVLGPAGVGKSRLVREFLDRLSGGTVVLRGRCLPYGEGITYWPLAEAARSAAGITDDDDQEGALRRLGSLLAGAKDADRIAARLATAIGLSDNPAPQAELFWAVRRTLEHLARVEPAVVLFEDIHWAEPTFLDLLDYLADWTRDTPILLLATARPELLDVRSGWGGGKLNATTVLLESLPPDATKALLDSLPGGPALTDALRERIGAVAEGNPLFVEELVAMLVDDGTLRQVDGTWTAADNLDKLDIPPTISALLAARLERLDSGERSVAERASVVGRVFEPEAVAALAPDRAEPLMAQLMALVRKELVRPDRSEITGGDAFRFRHILIRDAAYAAMSKRERAECHVRLADWLGLVTGDRSAEFAEIIGHHLEQAHAYELEIGGSSSASTASRAAEWLRVASRSARARGDVHAGLGLLRRAINLLPPGAPRMQAEVEAVRLVIDGGRYAEAAAALEDLGRRVHPEDALARAHLTVLNNAVHVETAEIPDHVRVEAEAQAGIGVFGAHGDELGMTRAYGLIADSAFIRGDLDLAAQMWREADDHANASGDLGEQGRIQAFLPATSLYGARTTSDAIAFCKALTERELGPMAEARLYAVLAQAHALRGASAEADAQLARSSALLEDLAVPWLTVETRRLYGQVHVELGRIDVARSLLIAAQEEGARLGLRQATGIVIDLAELAVRAGAAHEARMLIAQARAMPGSADNETKTRLAIVAAWADALADDADAARARLIGATDELPSVDLWDRQELLSYRAEVFALLGDGSRAADDLRASIDLARRKEMIGREGRLRARLDELAAARPRMGSGA